MGIYLPKDVELSHNIVGERLYINQCINRAATKRWETVISSVWARPNQVILETVKTYMSVKQRRFTHNFTHYLDIEAAEALVAHLQRCIASAKAQGKEN